MILFRTLIFTLLVPGSVVVAIPYLLLTSGGAAYPYEIGNLRWWIGIFPIAVGAAFYFWCAWDFAVTGRGTPAPLDPPKKLVARGLYRWVRNPMYVGVLLILIGESLVFESAILAVYACLAGLAFHLFVVFYEEPTLKGQFRADYEAYCRAVPRWIPKARGDPDS